MPTLLLPCIFFPQYFTIFLILVFLCFEISMSTSWILFHSVSYAFTTSTWGCAYLFKFCSWHALSPSITISTCSWLLISLYFQLRIKAIKGRWWKEFRNFNFIVFFCTRFIDSCLRMGKETGFSRNSCPYDHIWRKTEFSLWAWKVKLFYF